ncbi:MAG TPA: hypothetical protein EYP07_13315, partial [Kiloniellaceae bacterium]|nr:hypothetical protein [Kiloniellaceae bacterium]
HCGEPWPIHIDLLEFEPGTPADAERTAFVRCPATGCQISPREKGALLASGVWVGADQTITRDGEIVGPARDTDIASFRIDGLQGFNSWGRLARLKREADIAFETAQDEDALRAFYNVKAGHNYRAQGELAEPLADEDLAARIGEAEQRLGVVPPEAVCLTAAVDIQGNRFEVLVQAWLPALQSYIVDRFAILALDDGETAIDPANMPEHWHVLLEKVLRRRYPMAGDPSRSIAILNTAIDTGGQGAKDGEGGVTDNAWLFWAHAIEAKIPATAITMIKGGNQPKARTLPPPTIDLKRKVKLDGPDPELFVPNVNRMKTAIDHRLRRRLPGPGYIGLPSDLSEQHRQELTAEEKVEGLWHQKPGRRNETFDGLVYSYTALVRLAGGDFSLAWVPAWARFQAAPAEVRERRSREGQPAARPQRRARVRRR